MTTISCNNSIYIVPCNSVFLLRIYSPYARIHAYIPMPLVISRHVLAMSYRHHETRFARPLVAHRQLLICIPIVYITVLIYCADISFLFSTLAAKLPQCLQNLFCRCYFLLLPLCLLLKQPKRSHCVSMRYSC